MTVPSFDELLNALHEDSVAAADTDANYIEITSSRRFVIPEGFEKTIAYEGDVNSQIITFIAPLTSDNHDLSKCTNKKLRWANLASGNEGSSVLTSEIANGKLKLFWAAPAEAFTRAGQLRFSISFFDLVDKKIAYSWNTADCSELSVGASLDSVGLQIKQEIDGSGEYIPAKDEILVINADKRAITAPQNYRHMFCNYGDVDTSVVYFQIKRYVRGIDVLDENTQITVYSRLGNHMVVDKSIEDGVPTKILYAADLADRDSEGLVTIIWKPTRYITANSSYFTGKFRIQIELNSNGKIWRTSPYDNLEIGESELAFGLDSLPEIDTESGEKITGYVIDGGADFKNVHFSTVAGYVKLRECTTSNHIQLNRNELVVEYNDLGEYAGIKVGTGDGQWSNQAPYVTVSPNTTIRLYGGDINE